MHSAESSASKFERSAIQVGKIGHDRETESGARHVGVKPAAALGRDRRLRFRQARTIVIDLDEQSSFAQLACCGDLRARPLARIVEQIAEHLFEIFDVARKQWCARGVISHVEIALCMNPAHSDHKRLHNRIDRRGDAAARAGARRSRELPLDDSVHRIQLLELFVALFANRR